MKKFILFILLLFVIGAIIGGWAFKIIFISQSGQGQVKDFVISEGDSVKQISQNLKKDGLIDNSFIFETYLKLKKSENSLLAGEHKIPDNWSMRQLVNSLVSGSSIDNERTVKTLEGWNLYDLADYFAKEKIASQDELWNLIGLPGANLAETAPKYAADYDFLSAKPAELSLEGYLFPDTYRVFKDAALEDIIKKMLNNFDKKITSQMKQDIKARNMSLHEMITLASIIEKEAKTAADKKTVSGVYNNRLDIGMALQADPTVNYVTRKQTDRPSFDDLETDSLYNTYKYPGLPPGPICNPGLDSIMAAIYPENNDYYFFINTPDGDMIFAKTLEEHALNRAKYFKD